MMKMKFTIVIPCKNEKDYIGRCVQSILEQNYELNLIEIMIVDGFSVDGTRDILKNLQDKYNNIKVLDNPSGKTPQALNIGIKNSSGDAVIILGAHTELDKNFIRLNNRFLIDKNVKVTGGTQINVGRTYTQNLIGTVMEMPFAMASAKYRWSDEDYVIRYVDLPGFGYAKVSKTLKEVWQKSLVEFIQNRVSIRLFIHLRDARHPHAKIDKDVEKYISEFIRPDQRYLTIFTKMDKLNQKERAKLKREFPEAITISNFKRSGMQDVHRELFETVYGEQKW